MSSTSSSSTASSLTSVCDENIKRLFPLKSISDVVRLFKLHLETASEPDLTLLSIVTGIIENTLTSKCAPIAGILDAPTTATNGTNSQTGTTQPQPQQSPAINTDAITLNNFPVVQFETVQILYEKFKVILSVIGACKPIDNGGLNGGGGGGGHANDNKTPSNTKTGTSLRTSALNNKSTNSNASAAPAATTYATREIIKRVSDLIWNSLIRSTYKDRAHLQSLYSYLALSKLDCFGVALAVVAGCQQLGYKDVHLAISEDHAWVIFDRTGEETIEVTWHGKGG